MLTMVLLIFLSRSLYIINEMDKKLQLPVFFFFFSVVNGGHHCESS